MGRNLVLAIALLACGCDSFRRADDTLCAPPAGPPGQPRSVTPEQREATTDCVWYWSYRLAGAEGSIGDLAEAVMGACWRMIEHYEALTARDEHREADVARAAAPFRRDAVYRIAEARAGHCPAPQG
jgi:hypothetical protein